MSARSALTFLEKVYGEESGYIDLPSKVNGRWIPFICEWPASGGLCLRRITSCLDDGEDLYFSVAKFTEPRRREECTQYSRWLWADLDEAHPEGPCSDIGLLPTIAWSSSPGRYQALWRLKQRLSPQVHGVLNRALTVAVGADPGGWDSTQVLRIPGTRNWKYDVENGHEVKLLELQASQPYDAKGVFRLLTRLGAVQSAADSPTARSSSAPVDGAEWSGSVATLPVRAQRLLAAKEAVVGERSARLWELECLLVECGLENEQIVALIKSTVWNKWAGRRDEAAILGREVARARTHVDHKMNKPGGSVSKGDERPQLRVVENPILADVEGEDELAERRTLPWEDYATFLGAEIESPRWLIKDIWVGQSHGIIGGEPKTSKSMLALAMAISVASGKPFLGEYSVGVQGPVLFVQEENSRRIMQDRARKIAASYGLLRGSVEISRDRKRLSSRSVKTESLSFPSDVPIRFLNHYGFDLAYEADREMLESEVSQVRPALLVLDPLYLMLGGADENVSSHIRPFLKWLLYLRYQYDMAIAVVHHFRKGGKGDSGVRPGQRLLGSQTFHGWVDSAIYTEALPARPMVEGAKYRPPLRVKVEREFRETAAPTALQVELGIGEFGDLRFDVAIEAFSSVTLKLEELVEELCIRAGRERKGPLAGWVPIGAVCEETGMDKRTILRRLLGSEAFEIKKGGAGRGVSYSIRLAGGGGES